MKSALLVFIGGGIGSVFRYAIGRYLSPLLKPYPLGTFTVNIIGAFLIGIFLGYFLKNPSAYSPSLQLLLVVGFCGGFTTFSAFAFEQLDLLRNGQYSVFLIYTLASLLLGLLAAYAGFMISRQLG